MSLLSEPSKCLSRSCASRGDQVLLGACAPVNEDTIPFTLPQALVPLYPSHCVIYVLPGPHGDDEYITTAGTRRSYSTHWRISLSRNRLGIRLESRSCMPFAVIS
ncbi:hypothetical protein B0H34DRAFT_118146 [Crassisporium funariophilum]|nr:hypothetical protein B0H34DRAFT_118146 [Crassisporium funariophilum]